MKKVFYLVFVTLISMSCQESENASTQQKLSEESNDSLTESVVDDQPSVSADQKIELSELEIALAKKWLITTIEHFFEEDVINTLKSITTESYAEYKIDAMNLHYEQGLSHEEFERKWKGKFDVSQNAYNKGFLIDAQDNGKITVKKCDYLRNVGTDGCVFQVVLYDELFKSSYKSDVTVVLYEGSWAIGNVKDYFPRSF